MKSKEREGRPSAERMYGKRRERKAEGSGVKTPPQSTGIAKRENWDSKSLKGGENGQTVLSLQKQLHPSNKNCAQGGTL